METIYIQYPDQTPRHSSAGSLQVIEVKLFAKMQDTINTVKERIKVKEGFSSDDYVFLHRGSWLADDLMLQDCALTDQCFILALHKGNIHEYFEKVSCEKNKVSFKPSEKTMRYFESCFELFADNGKLTAEGLNAWMSYAIYGDRIWSGPSQTLSVDWNSFGSRDLMKLVDQSAKRAKYSRLVQSEMLGALCAWGQTLIEGWGKAEDLRKIKAIVVGLSGELLTNDIDDKLDEVKLKEKDVVERINVLKHMEKDVVERLNALKLKGPKEGAPNKIGTNSLTMDNISETVRGYEGARFRLYCLGNTQDRLCCERGWCVHAHAQNDLEQSSDPAPAAADPSDSLSCNLQLTAETAVAKQDPKPATRGSISKAAVAHKEDNEDREPCKNVAEGTAKVITLERQQLQEQQITKGAVQRMYQDDYTPGYTICAVPHLLLTFPPQGCGASPRHPAALCWLEPRTPTL